MLIARANRILLADTFGIYSGNMPDVSRDQDRFFRFLRKLRAGGRTNMYGAVPYLMRAFAVDRDRAFKIVCDWIDQLNPAVLEPLEPKPPRRKPGRRRAA